MSSLAPDAAEYYYQYKVTVYDNLFVGIVYGEGTRDPTLLVQFLSHYALHHRRLHRTLRHLGLRPLVRFICAYEGSTVQAYHRWLSGANRVSLRLGLEWSCLESRLSCLSWESSHWC